MKKRKNMQKKIILLVIISLLLIPTSVTSAFYKEINQKINLDEQQNKPTTIDASGYSNGEYSGLVLSCNITMYGVGKIYHHWIRNIAVLRVFGEEEDFTSEVEIYDIETMKKIDFDVTGKQKIIYVTRMFSSCFPLFVDKGPYEILGGKWHEKPMIWQWGWGDLYCDYVGDARLPEIEIPQDVWDTIMSFLEMFKQFPILSMIIFGLIDTFIPNGVFPGTEGGLGFGYLQITKG